jgi:hypothetical protein
MRPQGSPAELEWRRLRAVDLLQRDVPVHVVADRLGVDRRLARLVVAGPEAAGYATSLWTCRRIVDVIRTLDSTSGGRKSCRFSAISRATCGSP